MKALVTGILLLCSVAVLHTGAVKSGDNVQIWTCSGSDRQKWSIATDGSNNIRLTNAGHLCLNIDGGRTVDGTNVNVATCDKSNPKSQQFMYDGKLNRILALTTENKVLDGSNYGKTEGTNVWEWDWLNGPNQKWVYDNTTGEFRYKENQDLCLDAGTTIVPCSHPATQSMPFWKRMLFTEEMQEKVPSRPFYTAVDAAHREEIKVNSSLPIAVRVKNLVSNLTIPEMVGQLGNGAASIERLDIPNYQWWSEALHGLAGSPGISFKGKLTSATSFPQVINLGATFDMPLVKAMAEAISTEARAFHNQGQAFLTFFAPNINIYRDPRWGRGQETPGEDPYLTSQYVTNFVKGMQIGDDPRYLKTVVTCKHFSVYNLENYTKDNTDRYHFNAVVSDQDLMETYFPAFHACVSEGGAKSIMCSYNAVNGVPSCANGLFQNTVVRDEWGFDGYIVSDCGAIAAIQSAHHYTKNANNTVAVGLKGGCDLDCGVFYPLNAYNAYLNQTISRDVLALAMTRLFTARIRLGLFDPVSIQPYSTIPPEAVNSKEHQELALQLARESITLLTNDGTLPLKTSTKVAVIGPNFNATSTMQGNYQGPAPFLISPLMGIQALTKSVVYAPGCRDVWCADDSLFADAIKVAQQADVVVMVMGISTAVEGEAHDRTSITLPGLQEELMKQIKGNATKARLVVALMSGGVVDMSWAKSNANALLWVGYPGQSGGEAIADVLFGKFNPSGRLPWTMYPANYINEVDFANVSMRNGPGRTYRFYTGTPVFEFGFGLSYTTFEYQWEETVSARFGTEVQLSDFLKTNGVFYRVKVTNKGSLEGGVSVLAVMTTKVPGQPLNTLFGFQRIDLKPAESMELFFAMQPDTLRLVNEKGHMVFLPGEFGVKIGDLQDKFTLKV